jgi:hypothetical protein
MSTPESWFPPRRVADGEQRDVEISTLPMNDFRNDAMCLCSQASVASKEARFVTGVEQVHVGRATPTINRVPTALVLCACGVHHN